MLKRLPVLKPALALSGESAAKPFRLIRTKTLGMPLPSFLMAFFLLAPTLIVFAEKAVVPVGATLALIAGVDLLRRREMPRPPLGAVLLIIALLGLSAISTLWSIDPDRSAQKFGKVALLAAQGLLLLGWARSIRPVKNRLEDHAFISLLLRATAVGFIIAGLVCVANLSYADARRLPDFDRVVALMLLSLWPLAAALLASGERRLALLLAVVTSLAVALAHSRALKLGLVLSLATAGFALVHTRRTAASLAGVIVVTALAQCFVFWGIRDDFSRPGWIPKSFHHRIEIYDLAATTIFHRPWTGWGLGTFQSMPLEPGDLERFSLIVRAPSHAHSNFMEAWHDLGILGFILTLALPIAALRWSMSLPSRSSALALGGVVSTSTIAFVSFGLTQSAWLAILILSSALWSLVAELSESAYHGRSAEPIGNEPPGQCNAPIHILNIMLSRGDGGLERMALHHAKGLVLAGQRVTTLLHPKAKMWALARHMGLQAEALTSSRLNPFWPWVLRRRIAGLAADLVLAQGNRATYMAARAIGRRRPIVAVAHSTWLRLHPGVSGVVCLTPASLQRWKAHARAVAFSPNFLTETPLVLPRPLRRPPVIGAMGRLVAKKGMNDFIEAIALLKRESLVFFAAIAGEGPERYALEALVRSYGLEDRLTFAGWVDSRNFLRELDIFVLPSREEPFGIVTLEAWAAGLPVVATACEGPRSYIQHAENGLLIAPQAPAETAAALMRLLEDPDFALTLARNGQATFQARFGDAGGETLLGALQHLMLKTH